MRRETAHRRDPLEALARRRLGADWAHATDRDLVLRVFPLCLTLVAVAMLVIFWVIQPMGRGTLVSLPTTDHPETMTTGVAMDVVVQCDGRLFVDGSWVPADSLAGLLDNDERPKDLPVMISGSAHCTFAPVAEALRRFSESGRRRFFLRASGPLRLLPLGT